ncbi:MAG: hypothetical protein AAGG65_11025 [Pseudomonadota bacterium]
MTTSDFYLKRGQLALGWAASLVDPDIGFQGAGNVINAYYKSIVAMTTGARIREARVLAQFVERTFYKDGDVNTLPDDPTAQGLANYRCAWIGRGLQVLGRYDMAANIGRLVESQMHPVTGGLATLANQPPADRVYCLGSTGSAVLAFLAMGKVEAARRGGAFIAGLLDEQPVTKGKFYLLRNADGEIIREDRKQGLAMVSSIDIGTPGQVYWYIGMAMNACASLYLATGEQRWLDAGHKAYALFQHCADDIYRIISNGKVAWGLGWMHLATRDPAFAKAAQDVWAWHCDIQADDGRWLRVGQFDSLDVQPLHITLDTTLERAFYMFELSRTLDI